MSRSRRHTPITGFAGKSEKTDKVLMHKKLRQQSKQILQKQEDLDEAIFPIEDEVMDKWNMAKDGKQYFYKNSGEWYTKCLRK